MKLRFMILVIICVSSVASGPLEGGTILKWQEMSIENGEESQSTVIAYASELGVKVDITNSKTASKEMTVVYLKDAKTAYITNHIASDTISLTNELLADLERKARDIGTPEETEQVSVAKEEVKNDYNVFTCTTYSLKQANAPTRYVCLANPETIGIDGTTVENLRQIFTLMTSFTEIVERLTPIKTKIERKISFNTYDMKQGFPVREWEPQNGKNSMDSQLVSVSRGDVPSSYFRLPLK
jgi:hypothetical protein